MQKKIIALAIAAAFAAPVAMAEVTVYGTVDGGFRHQSQDKSATHAESVNAMTSGNYNSNRWGIKASEDMGGMKANVVLEGGFSIADGTAGVAATTTATNGTPATSPEDATYKTTAGQLFDRQATVGLSGDWGRVDFGRQNAINFKTAVALNPFASNYIGLANVTVASNGVVRLNRLSSYTGTFGDVTVMVEHAADNSVASNTATAAGATNTTTEPTTGASRAAGVSYKLADLVIAGSYTSAEATPDGTDEDNTKNTILGANYKIGDAKVFVATAKTTTKGAPGDSDAVSKVSWIGATYAMSDKVGLTAALYKSTYTATASTVESDSQRVMVGATYAMSKVTKLYAGVDTQTNNAGDVGDPDLKTQGVSLGVATAF